MSLYTSPVSLFELLCTSLYLFSTFIVHLTFRSLSYSGNRVTVNTFFCCDVQNVLSFLSSLRTLYVVCAILRIDTPTHSSYCDPLFYLNYYCNYYNYY